MMLLAITQQEARHLITLLQPVILQPDHLAVTHDVVHGTEITTEALWAKLLTFATAPEAEPVPTGQDPRQHD
jgi:hypothetical protein